MLNVWIFTRNLNQTKTILIGIYVHLAVNLKQWEKRKEKSVLYNVKSKFQELEKNLYIFHNQVTVNHFLISARKQKNEI